jgi:tRNA dimethylallyltransferase
VVRALEVFRATGVTISEQHASGAPGLAGFERFIVGLAPPREALRQAVVARTRAMFAGGLVEEVRNLLAHGLPAGAGALRAIGYRQAVAVVRGELSADEALRSVVTDTMRFAKRQMTWFRHQQPDTRWFADADGALAAVQTWLAARGPQAGREGI